MAVRGDGTYIDATFGRGGHSAELLARLGPGGRLWLLDQDPAAIEAARTRFGDDPRCRIRHTSFARLAELADEEGLGGAVDGLLLDLGVSSPQLDEPERGFSFQHDGPLDMRMNTGAGPTAREWLMEAPEREIVRVLREYGEERFARRIAATIVRHRDAGTLPARTAAFAELVGAAVPRHERHKHPATRTFQALRIAVNDELGALDAGLAAVRRLLAPGGRLVVISFHSLEDRRVKRFIRDASRVGELPPGVAQAPPELEPWLRRIGRAVRADEAELGDNRRARSAVMRCAERLP
ncbi:16S rRNA (cytosine(1402)-N(4))-methyltransferase RsmH [Arhodomonas aquaeolei]|nr:MULTISPECIES: 16S rRNA (cytosine(1402)-N(4))-methyltransferase RsmH [Arhodomonas]MCS4504712.1 16S rRNA (cytosine(1402)-N(4))-methyltransferase RsmH [Arhodomonas aquaeolei]